MPHWKKHSEFYPYSTRMSNSSCHNTGKTTPNSKPHSTRTCKSTCHNTGINTHDSNTFNKNLLFCMLQQWKKTLPILTHILHTVRNPRFTRHHFSSPLFPIDFHALLCRCKPGAADGLKGQPLVCKVDMDSTTRRWLLGSKVSKKEGTLTVTIRSFCLLV